MKNFALRVSFDQVCVLIFSTEFSIRACLFDFWEDALRSRKHLPVLWHVVWLKGRSKSRAIPIWCAALILLACCSLQMFIIYFLAPTVASWRFCWGVYTLHTVLLVCYFCIAAISRLATCIWGPGDTGRPAFRTPPKTISSGFLTREFHQGVRTLCKLFKNRRESIKYRRHAKRMMQIFVVRIVTHAHLYIKQYPFTVGIDVEKDLLLRLCGRLAAAVSLSVRIYIDLEKRKWRTWST